MTVSDPATPPSVFVSHDWEDEPLYERAVALFEQHFAGTLQDLSVPRSRAIAVATTRQAAREGRLSALRGERDALVARQRALHADRARAAELGGGGHDGQTLRAAIEHRRHALTRAMDTWPNARAREKYATEPLARLADDEQALLARSLIDLSADEALRRMSSELTAVADSLAAVERTLDRVEQQHLAELDDAELPSLAGLGASLGKLPFGRTMPVDRLLAEQLSALVARADVLLLLIGRYGMYKPWIYFELSLAVRHRRPIVAVPTDAWDAMPQGLARDLASFGAEITDWDGVVGCVRRRMRKPFADR